MNKRNDDELVANAPLQLFQGTATANPFPLLAQMRAMGPMIPLPPSGASTQQTWLVTRLEEVAHILKDKRFTVDPSVLVADSQDPTTRQRAARHDDGFFGQSMISVDEPDHRRLRGLVSQAFTPRYIQSLRPHIQQIADELLDKVQAQGCMDLVQDYAYPLPINVISDMLGIPGDRRDIMRQWSEAIAGSSLQSSSISSMTSVQTFSTYIREVIAEKRLHPQDDLISQLTHSEDADDHLTEAELISMIRLLIFAGHETTSNLIGIGTLMLFEHPDQFARLKADLSLVPSAVEELLRFNGPVLAPAPRFATQDSEIGGQCIHRGDMLITILASANRDELQITDPDELDIARTLNRHIAFGQGIHVCLGAPLARLEGDIAFTTLLQRMPNLQLDGTSAAASWHGGFFLRGLTNLPVTF